jgi:RimJ/RimL family protein N-acetyltransferase
MHKMLFEVPTHLETDRLRVRPYQPGDGAVYLRLCQNNRDHLLPFEQGNPALDVHTLDGAEILVREFAAAWTARNIFFMGAWEKTTGCLVAQIVLSVVSWDLPEFAVGYFVDKDHQGQGFVTEGVNAALGLAFDHLHAARVRLECNEINVRSIRVAERCGFVREGHVRQTHTHVRCADGSPSGDVLFGMLREEYTARNS